MLFNVGRGLKNNKLAFKKKFLGGWTVDDWIHLFFLFRNMSLKTIPEEIMSLRSQFCEKEPSSAPTPIFLPQKQPLSTEF